MGRITRRGLGAAGLGLVGLAARADAPVRTHGLSLLGSPALPADFGYFPHVDPAAPKGGTISLSTVGTFDSFNPFVVRGSPAASVARVWETLLRANADEAESAYVHLAAVIELAADRLGVSFELRPEARFHDGKPVTAEDVVWTFRTLLEFGRPHYRQYYADVASVAAEGAARVTFRFKTATNRELPLILGQLTVLPKHWWEGREFAKPLTEPPLGSGAYRIENFEFGRVVELARVKDWWAKELPTALGLSNFDTIRTEYFRDATVAMEAFKAGQIDLRLENVAKDWATGYDFPAVQKGWVKKAVLRHRLPTGMQGFFMNTRRPLFRDVRVRQALALVFDFEWANANLFYGSYTRTNSYFSNSELASSGLPEGAELALLERFRDKLPPKLFSEPYTLPVTDGSGNNRESARRALGLLKDAGWTVRDMKLADAQGNPFSFELLVDSPSYERLALPYVQSLVRLGIEAHVRTVDAAQYQRLMDKYDFDMTMLSQGQSDSPGNEQLGYWTCASVDMEGGDNAMGVCDPVVDVLVGEILKAPDRAALVAATRALDRVLLWGWYLVPHFHLRSRWVAYWDRFGFPDKPVRAGVDLDSWWIDRARVAALDDARRSN